MADRPILEAAYSLLKFKETTTIAEIARIAKRPQSDVLACINRNGYMVWRHVKSGKITKVAPREVLRDQLWKAGSYYHVESYDYGSTTGLVFKAHDDLRAKIEAKTWGGGIGDSYQYSYVPDTPENRAALEAEGCVHYDALTLDDRLWEEGP